MTRLPTPPTVAVIIIVEPDVRREPVIVMPASKVPKMRMTLPTVAAF